MIKRIYLIISLIFLFGFGANFIWEKMHIVLYQNYESYANALVFPVSLHASFIDAIIIFGIYFCIALLQRNIFWLDSFNPKSVFLVLLLGFIISVLIEVDALAKGKWAYNNLMPIIPFIRIGLSPVLQMLILPLIVFSAVKKTLPFMSISKKSNKT